MDKIKVLLVDDQNIIRDGLQSLLSTNPKIEVVGQAKNGKEACDLAGILQPDVILMDIRMPIMNGVEATKEIHNINKDIKIIILTTFDDDEYILEAMRNGASGYLLKDTSSEKLFEAIIDSVNGSIILPGEIALKIISHISKRESSTAKLDDFSEREMDIIYLLVQGKTNLQIAETLYLSVGTVKNYLSQIYSKSNSVDRSNAIIFFKKLGL